jgi:serine/threonine protein phosphatase PrpC
MVTELLSPEQTLEDQLKISVGFATDVGGRAENEDALHVAELQPLPSGDLAGQPGYLLAIADGMGGHQRGEVASSLAVETIREMFGEDPGADSALLLKQAFRRANERIYENGHALGEDAMMGTTLVVATTRGKYATIASIGDSRAYLIRANRVTQITQDHSLVAEQVAQGAISPEEARESPHRNILIHALGHRAKLDPRMPSVFEITLLPEDRLLLCTDGFYDVASDDDLLEVAQVGDPQNAAQALVNTAVERGATDNVTAIIASIAPSRVREQILASETTTDERSNLVLASLIAAIAFLVVIAVVLFVLLS